MNLATSERVRHRPPSTHPARTRLRFQKGESHKDQAHATKYAKILPRTTSPLAWTPSGTADPILTPPPPARMPDAETPLVGDEDHRLLQDRPRLGLDLAHLFRISEIEKV